MAAVGAPKTACSCSTAATKTRSNASRPCPPYYVLLHGIVQHDVYHSGQVALLKKAI
jgi:hypothetical protein